MLLVTGATGFLGAQLVALCVRPSEGEHEGRPVRAVVRDPSRGDVLPPGVERVAADLADEESLVRAMDGCDGVLHLAAAVGAPGPEARELNVGGTERVVAAARRAGVRRLVHTSTSAAILAAGPPGGPCVVAEDAVAGTILHDHYSATKADAEQVVLEAAHDADGPDAVVATLVNLYGPSPRGPRSYNILLDAAARGRVGDIVDTTVGWTLAADAAAGLLFAHDRGGRGQRYVLCGEVATFPRVLDGYCAAVGSPHRVRALPQGSELGADAPPFAERSVVYGHVGGYRVEDAGARALGFAPRGIDAGLAETAAWLPGAG